MNEGDLISYIAAGLLAGVALIFFLAFKLGIFNDTERPKYEMLDISPLELPEASAPSSGNANEGAEDRIVRLSVAVLAFYYALARLSMPSVGSIVLVAVGLYLTFTAVTGSDPIYRLRHWDTRLPEHRGRR